MKQETGDQKAYLKVLHMQIDLQTSQVESHACVLENFKPTSVHLPGLLKIFKDIEKTSF